MTRTGRLEYEYGRLASDDQIAVLAAQHGLTLRAPLDLIKPPAE